MKSPPVTPAQKAAIRKLWPDMALTVEAIADRVGLTKSCVSTHANRMGLPKRPRRGPLNGKPCFKHRTCRHKWTRLGFKPPSDIVSRELSQTRKTEENATASK
jgi:hypothetical protein